MSEKRETWCLPNYPVLNYPNLLLLLRVKTKKAGAAGAAGPGLPAGSGDHGGGVEVPTCTSLREQSRLVTMPAGLWWASERLGRVERHPERRRASEGLRCVCGREAGLSPAADVHQSPGGSVSLPEDQHGGGGGLPGWQLQEPPAGGVGDNPASPHSELLQQKGGGVGVAVREVEGRVHGYCSEC